MNDLHRALKLLPLALALTLAGCSVGPDYHRPATEVPLQFKEAQGWIRATPQDQLSKGEWWAVYRDPVLSDLLRQVQISNQNVAQYQALYRQALARESRADLYPSVTGTASSTR